MKKQVIIISLFSLATAAFVGCHSDSMEEPAGASTSDYQSEQNRNQSDQLGSTNDTRNSESNTNSSNNGSSQQP